MKSFKIFALILCSPISLILDEARMMTERSPEVRGFRSG